VALKRLAIGAAALSAARATQTALTFLALPLLARLLDPSEFGLVALGMAFVLFTMSFSDAGMGQSLVRTPATDKHIWSSAFWMIVLLSGTLSVFLLAIAWPAGYIFNEPDLTPLVYALAPLPLIQGTIAPAMADLQQREKFLTLAGAEAVAALAGTVAAVWVALSGGGAWALVAQQLAMWIGKAIVVLLTTRFRPSFEMRISGLGPHFRFGLDTAGWSLVNFFARQVDPLVIAKFISTTALGFYSIAYRLMCLPMYLVSGPIQSTLYTRMVRLRDNPAALRSLVFIASRVIASFVFPPMAVLCVAGTAFMHVFLSERWEPAGLLFSILAPVGALQTVTALNGALFMATNRTDLRLKLVCEFTILWVIAAPLLALVNVTTVAVGYAVLFMAYLPRTLQLFLKPIDGRIRDYVAALSIPLLVSVGLALAHLLAKALLHPSPWVEIGLAAGEVLVGYGLIAWALHGRLRADLLIVRNLFTAVTPLAADPVVALPVTALKE
jgi:O-antigen/teichoic acid export membrane protein